MVHSRPLEHAQHLPDSLLQTEAETLDGGRPGVITWAVTLTRKAFWVSLWAISTGATGRSMLLAAGVGHDPTTLEAGIRLRTTPAAPEANTP